MASNAEIARDIVVAMLAGAVAAPRESRVDAAAAAYKTVLAAVGEAVELEEERERAAAKRRRNEP